MGRLSRRFKLNYWYSSALTPPEVEPDPPAQDPTLNALAGSFTTAENSPQDTLIGAITGKTVGSVLSLFDNAGGRVKLVEQNIVVGPTNPNFEEGASYSFTVRETLVGATNSPRDTVFTLNVTNEFEEPTLGALALDVTELTQGETVTVNILGATEGSTIAASTLPAGMTLDSAARTISGTPTNVESVSIVLNEYLPDSSNSGRGSNVGLNVTAAPAQTYLVQGNPIGYFQDGSGPPSGTTRATFRMRLYQPVLGGASQPFAQVSTGCDLVLRDDGSAELTLEDGSGARIYTLQQIAVPGTFLAATYQNIVLDIDMIARTATLTVDGTDQTLNFAAPGNPQFQTSRAFMFAARAGGGQPLETGTRMSNMSLDLNGVRHKTIPNDAASANIDPWKNGEAFTDGTE